jgi:hypothetical protein
LAKEGLMEVIEQLCFYQQLYYIRADDVQIPLHHQAVAVGSNAKLLPPTSCYKSNPDWKPFEQSGFYGIFVPRRELRVSNALLL